MKKTICLDFGNSRKKIALFNDDQFAQEWILGNEDDELKKIQLILDETKPDSSILSSVVKHDKKIEELLAKNSRFHLLNSSSKINFSIPASKPETVGADRLALISAAIHFFPKKNNLIIALGTCITYNFVNQYHQFLGGGISPGLDMRFKSMHDYTALLPIVKSELNPPLIGYDTKTNMQSGVIYGIAGEIEGVIERYADRFGNFNVVLTGGNSAYFAGLLKCRIFADFNFLYKGLYALSEINNCTD